MSTTAAAVMAMATYDDEPIEAVGNEDEVAFGYRIGYTYARWAHFRYAWELGVQQARIWGYKVPVKGRHGELCLSDDDMLLVDRSVTRLSWRERKLIFCEFFADETLEQKARRFNLGSRRSYRRRVDEVMFELYQSLMPKSETWRLAVL